LSERKLITGVITSLVNDEKILLIKRAKPPFAGYWGLPGGKIEFGEHPEEAAVREAKEETGIVAEAIGVKGILSEMIKSDRTKEILNHFVLFICELKPQTLKLTPSDEGELKWFDLDRLEKEATVVPSDAKIIKEIIQNSKELKIYRSHLLDKDAEYLLESFG